MIDARFDHDTIVAIVKAGWLASRIPLISHIECKACITMGGWVHTLLEIHLFQPFQARLPALVAVPG
jgi:hypothetical protein